MILMSPSKPKTYDSFNYWVPLMISKVASTALADAASERSMWSRTDLAMVSLVRVMMEAFCNRTWMRPRRHRDLEKYALDPRSESTGQVYGFLSAEVQWVHRMVFDL